MILHGIEFGRTKKEQKAKLASLTLGGKKIFTLTGITAMDGRFEVIGEQQYGFGGVPQTNKLWHVWDYEAHERLHLGFGGTWTRTKREMVKALPHIAARVMKGELNYSLDRKLKKPEKEPVQAWW
jgi:hypothetical protein